mgnify:CR=1 FL=1
MQFLRNYMRSPAAVIGLVLLLAIISLALTADIFFPKNPLGLAGRPLQWPFTNPAFPLGTDHTGRDIRSNGFGSLGRRTAGC